MADAATMMTGGQATTDTGSAQGAAESTAQTGEQTGQQQQQTAGEQGTQNAAETASQGATEGEQGIGESQGDKTGSEEQTGEQPKGAPEQYEDFKAPEGVQLDTEAMAEFKGIAKELNLSQEDAQKVADVGAKLSQKWAAKQAEAFQQVQTEWAESSKGDKEFGGEKLTENLAIAKKALDTFGTPELRQLLNESGLGNHPELIRAFYRAGKAISEDRGVVTGGSGQQGGGKDLAKTLYPNQK